MTSRIAKKLFAAASSVVMLATAAPAFAAAHSVGQNVSTPDGTVWMIFQGQSGVCRRAYTSAGAFLSYGFNSWSQVVAANSDDTALPVCSEGFIPPQDGSVVFSDRGADKGTGYIVSGAMKYGFPTEAIFKGQGYSYSTATWADMSWMSTGGIVNAADAAHLPGTLVNNGGTVQLVGNTGLMGIPDLATFNSWGYSFAKVVPANANDKAKSQTGVMAMRQAGQLSPTGMTTTPGPVTGSVNVALASDTPAAMTIATGSANNQVLKFNVSGTGSITGVKLTKTGYYSNTNVSGVGIYDWSGRRHGNVVTTLGADGVAVLTFASDPIVVSSTSPMPVWIKVNIATGSSTGTIGFNVAAAGDVTVLGGTAGGTFPVVGNMMNIVSGSNSIATVSVDEQPVNTGGATYNVDPASAQDISKFRFQETTSNEAVNVYGMTLFNNGTAADGDIQDVQLFSQEGNLLATAQQVNKNVTFALSSPYKIDKGQTRDFTVKAKIVNGAGRTIQFVIYNNYDIDARGISTGAGLLGSASGSNDTSFPIGDSTSTYNKVTIGSGSLVFSKATDSPTSSIVPGASDVIIAKYTAKPIGEDMEIRGLTFGIDYDAVADLAGTVYVKVDGNTVFSAAANGTNFVDNTASARTLSSYPIIKANVASTITVVVSISTSATANDTVKAVGMDVTSVKRLITGDITDPGVGAVSANVLTLKGASLTVTTLATPVASSVVAGSSSVPFASFELNAQGSGEDVRVTAITVTDTKAGGSSAYSDITNLVMYDAQGNQLTTSSSTATNANTVAFTFTQPIFITKNTAVTLTLKGDVISTAAATTSHTYKIASTNLTSYGKDTGNPITSTYSGTGQAQTFVAGGTLTGSLVTGSSATPSQVQLARVGQADGVYFKIKLTSQYEAQKITSLTLRAAGTSLHQNVVRNLRLFENDSTTAFATASQFSTCSSNACSNTWTASDNLLSVPIPVGGSTYITVKADIGAESIGYIADDFYMKLDMTTGNDITAKGVTSGSAPTYAGGNLNNSSTNVTRVVPFSVVPTGDYPTSGITTTVGAGSTIARFKVQNNGSAQITLTSIKFTDGGGHTNTTTRYTLYASGQNTADYTANSLGASSTDFASGVYTFSSLTTTIDGGSYRYFTLQVSTLGGLVSTDTYNVSIAAKGDVKYSVTEANLGYDADQDGAFSSTIASIYADGPATTATITKQ